MTTFKFGGLTKKTLEIDTDGNISVNSRFLKGGEFTVDEITTIFLKKPSLTENGEAYLSFDGEPSMNPDLRPNGFHYTRKQQKDLEELIALLQTKNGDISIEERKGTTTVKASSKKTKVDKKAIKCPKCKSTNVQFMDNKRKGFSVGKAVAGGALTGGIGTLAGFAGKKGKDRWHCSDCGNTFVK